jgi:hypothetical protein
MEVTHAQAWSPPRRDTGAWARRSFLELGSYPTAPGSARGHAANVLREWRLAHLIDPAEMIVSELVTNSVLATEATHWPVRLPPVRLWLLGDDTSVLVRVWDALPYTPRPQEAQPDDESGRGLAIVASLSAKWGHDYPPRETGGKITWALITTPWPTAA